MDALLEGGDRRLQLAAALQLRWPWCQGRGLRSALQAVPHAKLLHLILSARHAKDSELIVQRDLLREIQGGTAHV